MKKFLITSEVCNMPVVDMVSGHVVARSFTPFYDEKSLALRYLELVSESGDLIRIPFSSVCFINDICTMVNLTGGTFESDGKTYCNLLGAPLTAKAGSVSLFNFGSIAKTEVGEDGEMLSIVLNDGHSFLIPSESAPANAVVNDAFASEAYSINQNLRVSVPKSEEKPEDRQPAPEKDISSFGADIRPIVPPLSFADEQNEPSEKTVLPLENEKNGEPEKTAAAIAANEQPQKKNESEEAKKAKSGKAGKGLKSVGAFLKNLVKLRKFVAPVVAMLVFFVLYFIMFQLFIKV